MRPVISAETARRIWLAHREIEEGVKLLEQLVAEKGLRTPFDRGQQRGYQLGVLHGAGQRLMDVSPRLAAAIVEAHIAEKRSELVALTATALAETEGARL